MENNQDHNINYEYITRYIQDTLKPNGGLLREIERSAATYGIPIAQPETMRFIEVLLKASRAETVLEIGAAVGYSAISMAMCGCAVVTVERDETMLAALRENIGKSGLAGKITVMRGDAADVLAALDGSFDFIFLDAAKAQYLEFLPHCMRLLRRGGILFSDNVLYKGMVATDELFRRRKITIIRRLRKYLDEI